MANRLLLNPRLSTSERERFESAWREHVEGRFTGQVGIATSGSSGEGSGRLIVLSESALEASATAVNEHLLSSQNDVWMKTLPEFHVGGLGILVRAKLNGAGVVESKLERWDAEQFYDELAATGATLLSLVPTQLFDLVALGRRCPTGLRAIVIGGGRLSEDLYIRARTQGWPVLPSYGLTECCSQVATASLDSLAVPGGVSSSQSGSSTESILMGTLSEPALRPLKHVRLEIAGDGAIEISSSALLTGQIIFAKDGASRFIDPKVQRDDSSLWFKTEDRGRLFTDGSLRVDGRTIDFVKIGGEGVVISRLEEKLEKLKHELHIGFDAVVLAASDERLGAKIVLVSTAGESETKPLVEAFNQAVLPFERIRSVYVAERIPRSALGKLLRFETLTAVGLKPVVHV